jgi:hypothetical protein
LTERIAARRTIHAPPEAIFEVLTDPDGHVAIDASGMLQAATGTSVTETGDRFLVHMDREALGDLPMGTYDVNVVITRLESEAAIEWTIEGTVKPPIGHVYGYQLQPAPGGATVVESYCDWSGARPEWKSIFPVIDQKSLRASLGLLERAVRRGYPSRSARTASSS